MSDATPPARKRGRETAADMIRSLGLVLLLVLFAFWLAQPPDSDKAEVRVIDPATETRSFTQAAPGAVVPGPLPAGWRPTVAAFQPGPPRLRIGFNTPAGEYAEFLAFAVAPGQAPGFVDEATGEARSLGDLTLAGATWEQRRDEDGSLSLVRRVGDVTVVVGGVRATTTLVELEALAAAVGQGERQA